MSSNLSKVNMSLDEIIKNDRSNRKSLNVTKGSNDRNYDQPNRNFRMRGMRGNNMMRGMRGNNMMRGMRGDNNQRSMRDDNMMRRGGNRMGYKRYNNFEDRSGQNGKPRLRERINTRRNYQDNQNRDESRNNTRLFVSNLHKDIINAELKNIFSRIGPLKRCGIHWDNLGNSKGTADVEYRNPQDAKKAIEDFDNAEIDGMHMKVSFNNREGPMPVRIRLGNRRDDESRRGRGGLFNRGGSMRGGRPTQRGGRQNERGGRPNQRGGRPNLRRESNNINSPRRF